MKKSDFNENKESEYLDFYQSLRRKIREQVSSRSKQKGGKQKNAYEILVDYLILLPDLFHLAVKLIFDRRVPPENKGALVAAVIYVVSPLDLIPDTIPVAGWVDDLIILIIGLNKFLETENENVAAAVKRHWAGDEDVFYLVRHILSIANAAIEFLPKNIIRLIKDLFK